MSHLQCPTAEAGQSQSPSSRLSKRNPLQSWLCSYWRMSGERSAGWWRSSRLRGLRWPAPCTGALSGDPAYRWSAGYDWSSYLLGLTERQVPETLRRLSSVSSPSFLLGLGTALHVKLFRGRSWKLVTWPGQPGETWCALWTLNVRIHPCSCKKFFSFIE